MFIQIYWCSNWIMWKSIAITCSLTSQRTRTINDFFTVGIYSISIIFICIYISTQHTNFIWMLPPTTHPFPLEPYITHSRYLWYSRDCAWYEKFQWYIVVIGSSSWDRDVFYGWLAGETTSFRYKYKLLFIRLLRLKFPPPFWDYIVFSCVIVIILDMCCQLHHYTIYFLLKNICEMFLKKQHRRHSTILHKTL